MRSWAAFAEDREAKTALVRRSLLGLTTPLLRAWTVWVERLRPAEWATRVVWTITGVKFAYARWRAEADQLRALRNAVSGMRKPGCKRALNAWMVRAAHEASAELRMSSALREWTGRGVRRGQRHGHRLRHRLDGRRAYDRSDRRIGLCQRCGLHVGRLSKIAQFEDEVFTSNDGRLRLRQWH